MSDVKVYALWFDSRGCGPDHFRLEVVPMPKLMDGEDVVSEATMGIRLRAGELVINGQSMIDGGFMMDREQASELYRQIGEWLSEESP